MDANLLTHLTPEEQAAWERCQAILEPKESAPGAVEWIAQWVGHLKTVWMGDKGYARGGLFGTTDDLPTTLPEVADFIAAARTDLPATLTALAQTRAALTEARGAMEKYGRHQDHCAVLTNLHDAMCTCGYEAARTGREGTA